MIKMLSIDATNDVIQHWVGMGYTIVFTFTPNEKVGTVRPKMAKDSVKTKLDKTLTGSW